MGNTRRSTPIRTPRSIVSIKTYKKEQVNRYWKAEEDTKTLTVKKEISNIREHIPQNIIWNLENDNKIGCQELANFLKVKVILVIVSKSYYNPIKGISTNYISSNSIYGGGYVETDTFTKPNAPIEVFYPDEKVVNESEDKLSDELCNELKKCEGVQVVMNPDNDHYLSNCEYRKVTSRSMCKGCFYPNGRTTWLKGTGNKSSGKTKGKSKEYDLDTVNMMNDIENDDYYDDDYVNND